MSTLVTNSGNAGCVIQSKSSRRLGKFLPAMGMFCIIGLLGQSGCQQHQVPPPPPQVSSADRLAQIRHDMPEWVVGQVTAVDVEDQMAAVGDVDPKLFKVGDLIVFLDSSGGTINHGHVLGFGHAEPSVHVRYDDTRATRSPVIGDLAAKISGEAAMPLLPPPAMPESPASSSTQQAPAPSTRPSAPPMSPAPPAAPSGSMPS